MLKAKITGKRQITIPMDVCKDMQLDVGDELGFIKDNAGKYTLVKVDQNKNNLCPVCGKEVYVETAGGVHFGKFKYHLSCWFGLSDIEKVKKIVYNHNISDEDCKEILNLINNKYWTDFIIIYSNDFADMECKNIGKLLIEALKDRYQ